MGLKATEPLQVAPEELSSYLSAKHSLYMDTPAGSFYLTDANENFWRVQDCALLNDKGHYTDVTAPVESVDEFLATVLADGKTVAQVAAEATLYASEK